MELKRIQRSLKISINRHFHQLFYMPYAVAQLRQLGTVTCPIASTVW